MILDYVALGTIVFMAIGAAAAIVVTGGLPGKIARRRNHPWPDAVNIAGWIGLATGILWPLALVWAFLPVPAPYASAGQQSETDVYLAGTTAPANQQGESLAKTDSKSQSDAEGVGP